MQVRYKTKWRWDLNAHPLKERSLNGSRNAKESKNLGIRHENNSAKRGKREGLNASRNALWKSKNAFRCQKSKWEWIDDDLGRLNCVRTYEDGISFLKRRAGELSWETKARLSWSLLYLLASKLLLF